ncbi:proline--tRNA ligase [Candidatus Peribacteria bacterium]|nr:proline--tRNA ligase [Candidatus Peribacteria bacterium]
MAKQLITPRAQNFPQWYQDVIAHAPDLYDESPVTGCITFGPLGTRLWESIKQFLDPRFKRMGVENILLPTLIPESFFAREKEHVEGFAPEAAVVTHAGGSKLPEPYYVRPTSELLFVDWYGRSGKVQSYRDLPLLVNQWGSVVRWEKRPRAFLRTTEFYWHEGHCLFATKEQCKTFTLGILDLFAELCEDVLAIPVIRGDKPSHEKFAGADNTFTIESMMQDGKALQMGTSHMLSQNFLIDSDGSPRVSFLNEKEERTVPYYDSWAVSSRLIGAMIMTHGDDDGIVIPPKAAAVQVCILPIFGSDSAENEKVLKAARDLAVSISKSKTIYAVHGRANGFEETSGDLTVRIDAREARLGDKTFHQIRMGTPVRIELGARDLAENSCMIKSRIRSRDDAQKVSLSDVPKAVEKMLEEDQNTLFAKAIEKRKANIAEPENFAALKAALEQGKWALVAWDGTKETVEKLKAETSGGTYRCFAFDGKQDAKGMNDPVSGKPSAFSKRIYVAKAY